MMRTLLLFLLCCSASLAAPAAESQLADVAGALRALSAEARRSGDLWTNLQIESYAAAYPSLRVRTGTGYLGRSEIIGDARFAFPEDIVSHWDRGDWLGVISGRRFYRIDEQGRPLQLSRPLPIWPGRSALNREGNRLALANTEGRWNARVLQVALVNADDGSTVWERSVPLRDIPEGQNDALHNSLRQSVDGSVIVAAVYRVHGDFQRLFVVTPTGHRMLENLREPAGVGANATWLIADRTDRQSVLIHGNQQVAINAHAIGPGVAMVLREGAFEYVDRGGQVHAYTPHVAIGRRPDLWTVGDWLVIGSGYGASAEATTDLLGNVVEEGGEQPYTLALYRWQDLLENRSAEPVMRIENTYSRCRFRPFALYVWQDKELSLLDLSGDEPQIEAWFESSLPIHGVWDQHHYTMVQHPEGRRSVYDNQGQELWHGVCNDAWVHNRRRMLFRVDEEAGPRFTTAILDPDPLQRVEVPLQLPPAWWRISTHPWDARAVADSNELWHELNLETGAIERTVQKNPLVDFDRPPRWHGENNSHGRFYRRGGRLLAKAADDVQLDFQQQLVPQDAFHAGRGLLILDESAEILMFSRNSLESLGKIHADGIYTDSQSSGLFLGSGRQRRLVARLERGPSLETDLGPNPGQGVELPSGRWRIDRQRFRPPRSSTVAWDSDKAGFSPRRIRSGGDNLLIVVTSSLLILLEERAIPLVSSIVR